MVEATKRVLKAGSGAALLVVGLVMIPLPGPGLPLVIGGLYLLAPHSSLARRLVERLRRWRERRLGR